MWKSVRRLTAAAVFASACISTADAAMTNTTMLSNFNVQNLSEVANAIGYQSEVLTLSNGKQALGLTSPSGIKFIASPTVCDTPNGCIGLEIFANFGSSSVVSTQILNDFNYYRVFSKAYTVDGKIYLARYEICDFGIPAGNVASNFTNFNARAEEFISFVQSGGRISSKETTAPGPAFAAALLGFAGTAHSTAPPEEHFTAVDSTGKYVNAMKPNSRKFPEPARPFGPPR